jgi:hypothetical protein
MQRLLFLWLVWVALATVSLKTWPHVCLADSRPSHHTSHTESVLAQAHGEVSHGFLNHTSSRSYELSLRCERQSKKLFTLARRFDVVSRGELRDLQWQPELVIVASPLCFLTFRKLSLSSSTDDPFLTMPLC